MENATGAAAVQSSCRASAAAASTARYPAENTFTAVMAVTRPFSSAAAMPDVEPQP